MARHVTITVAEAGRHEVKVVPVVSGWAPMNLSWLEFRALP